MVHTHRVLHTRWWERRRSSYCLSSASHPRRLNAQTRARHQAPIYLVNTNLGRESTQDSDIYMIYIYDSRDSLIFSTQHALNHHKIVVLESLVSYAAHIDRLDATFQEQA